MYYLNSRYYDPEVGRFISPDTTDILEVQDDLYDKTYMLIVTITQ